VVAVLVLVAFVATGGSDTTTPPSGLSFHSAPGVSPPRLEVDTVTPGAAPGDIFLAPKRLAPQAGPMITDGDGRLVWFRPVAKGEAANSFRVQAYRGKPVLTWWRGHTDGTGHGHGVYEIADTRYRIIATVRAGRGLQGDMHEFRLTPRGTALFTIYRTTRADLRAAHGPARGKVIDSIAQEVDVKTGKLLFRWSSLDHVPVGESYVTPRTRFASADDGAFDYFHINSVDEDADGNLLISGRNTDAIYKVDRRTGRIDWRLGGRRSDFTPGPGARFAFQHDAEWQPGGRISIFDNGASPQVEPESRAIVLKPDAARKTVALVHAFTHPDDPISAAAEGNVELLPNGNWFVNWGFGGASSEFTPAGRLVWDARLPEGVESYRAYRDAGWHGQPDTKPAVAAGRRGDGVTVWASWNGATDVARWQVLAGPRAGRLAPVSSAARHGFETAIGVPDADPVVAVRALDGAGHTLATSASVRVGEGGR
jgi:hypothetical protein